LKLEKKMGPILWQLPPNFKFDPDRLERFFDLLPRDTDAAAKLAKKHDARMKGKTWTEAEVKMPIRYALEIRHESFKDEAFIKLMRKHKVAIVIADTAGKWPVIEDVTADFLYLRLHGDEAIYVSGYSDEALDRWASKLNAWRQGDQPADAQLISPKTAPSKRKSRDVYVYFDNDVKVRSPRDAMGLATRLGIKLPPLHDHEFKPTKAAARSEWPGMQSSKNSRKKRA
jgi:uncharacterized protein YecE (DUF72 family)